MIPEIFEALLKAALPVAVLSFFLVRWSLKSGRVSGVDSRTLRSGLKTLRENRKAKGAKTKNPVHNKWMKFGGGFYGAVGLYTFLLIETLEVIQFAQGYEGVDAAVAKLGETSFVDLGVNFLVNSLMNFVAAIAWPAYWLSETNSDYILLWLAMAYGGYWLGMTLARLRKTE